MVTIMLNADGDGMDDGDFGQSRKIKKNFGDNVRQEGVLLEQVKYGLD